MRAIRLTAFGSPSVLQLAEVPRPEPGPGEVLIRVHAAGINFAETLMRQDRYIASWSLPATPGSEVAGTVAALGSGVTSCRIGQRVGAIMAASRRLTGGYAEYALADEETVVPLDDRIDDETAVGLLVQGLTALYLLRAHEVSGREILITAAAGGVGSLLVQLAALGGARRIVAAAGSQEKRQRALAAGATTAVGYDALAQAGVELAFYSLGGEYLADGLAGVVPRGTLIVYGSIGIADVTRSADAMRTLVLGNRALHGFALANALDLATLRSDAMTLQLLTVEGKLVVETHVLRLDQAAEAHAMLEQRRSTGKLVLQP